MWEPVIVHKEHVVGGARSTVGLLLDVWRFRHDVCECGVWSLDGGGST